MVNIVCKKKREYRDINNYEYDQMHQINEDKLINNERVKNEEDKQNNFDYHKMNESINSDKLDESFMTRNKL